MNDAGRSARRADLDAARGLAMLLGLALHAAMAYIGPVWLVADEPASGGLGIFVSAVHGFRMPLFFLLSGFFTAMLWRRRGLAGLVSHRVRRVVLPLAIGCVTLLPVMGWVSSWALAQTAAEMNRGTPGAEAGATDLWSASASGDLKALRAFVSEGAGLDALDPVLGVTPLGWSVIMDRPEATSLLLELGANPRARYLDGNTPLHTACFFGRVEVAERLLEAGVEPDLASASGSTPAGALGHDRATTEFFATLLKVPYGYDEITEGRERIRAMLGAGVRPGARGWWARLEAGAFFQHLWFLWFLCWLNAGFVAAALVLERLPKVRLPGRAFTMPLCLVWVTPITMAAQFFMHDRGTSAGFGPDTSAGLAPMPHVLVYYAIFFGYGALAFVSRGGESRLGRHGWACVGVAILILPWAMRLGYGPKDADLGRGVISNLLQVLYAWLMSLGVLGLCESWLRRPRAWVSYLARSSYWVYLAHLPLVIAGQVLLSRTELPTMAKFAGLLAGSLLILLAVYHVAVRRTWIGVLLNGRSTAP